MKSNNKSGEVVVTDKEKILMKAIDRDVKNVFKGLLEEGFEYTTREKSAERFKDAINTTRTEHGLDPIKIIDTSER